ncbi:MAG: DNA translocase FtsK 4TM domain-containing protein, partial [Candidatus Kapaibacterium sp.]
MLNQFEQTDRPSIRVTRSGNTRSAGYSRVIPIEPDDAQVPDDADFLYPQELEEVVEPVSRQRRPRGARPMPKRLSEEFEEEEAKAPATRRRSARTSASEAPQTGEQIPLKLRTPPKKPDNTVKQRQVLGVLLVLSAIFIVLAIISYSAQDTAQAETRLGDLPAVFTRSDPTINANADTAHNWLGLVGAMLANFFINKTIGYAAIIFPIFLGWWSLALFKFSTKQRRRLTLATTFMLISAVLFSATIGTTQLINALPHLDREWSGAIGQFLGLTFTRLIGSIGALLIYTTSFVVMLVFAIDLDLELTFRRVKGGYTGLSGKTRMKLIEFWDKREAKKQEKLLRKEQQAAEIEEETEQEVPGPLIAKEEKVVVRQTDKKISPIGPIAKEQSTQTRSDDLDPARDIIIRSNGSAQTFTNGKAASESSEKISPNAPFLKVRPAPKTGSPAAQPVPRLTKNSDNVLGEKTNGLSRLSGGAFAIPPSRSVRILPSDVAEAQMPVAKEVPIVKMPERLTPQPVIEEKIPLIEIGDEKVLSNEVLPHSLDVASEFAAIPMEPKTPAAEKISSTLFPLPERSVVPENPYNEHLSKYRHPALDLLTPVDPSDVIDTDDEELAKKGTLLRDKLATFGVEIEN